MAAKTNRYAQPCNECGGEVPAGQGVLWYQAGPDDGGDVAGRTPAGWRVSHHDGLCVTQPTASALKGGWALTAPALATVAEIDECDSWGRPLPQRTDAEGIVWVKKNWPSRPVAYRPVSGGYEYLGEKE